jgi:hypothetical protein
MREILVLDQQTGLPKRVDGTIPEWALERKRRAEEHCNEQGWPTDFSKLSLAQLNELQEVLKRPA